MSLKILLGAICVYFWILNTSAESDDFLSKFHQNDYKVEFERIEVEYVNPEYFYYYKAKTYKFNRTTAAVNFTLKSKVDLTKDETYIIVQTYKFLSNEYRHFPMRFQVKLCQVYEFNICGFGAFETVAGIKNCTIEKDTKYELPNFTIDESQLPPLIPNGAYMSTQDVQFKRVTTAILKIYAKVYRPMKHKLFGLYCSLNLIHKHY